MQYKNFRLFENSGRGQFICGLIFLLFISYFVIFFHLDRLSLRVWDESTYLFNAENMLHHPDLIMVYDFNGNPETFSPKPPFYVWVAALSVKLLPNNPELAIRMPATIFVVLTVLLIYAFCYYYLKNFAAGILSALVFLSSIGYFQWHIARTGDTDSTFVFWCLFSCISFFIYTVEDGNKRIGALVSTGLGLLLATLTKGPGIIILLPSLFLWLLLNKKLIKTLSSRSFWIVFGLLIIIIFTWYFKREQVNPGFLEAVWHQELMGRLVIVEPQTHEINHALYFIYRLFDQNFFMPWIIFIIPVMIIILIKKEQSTEIHFIKFISLVWLVCIFSISQTASVKDWYDAIWYPLMALIVGVGIAIIIKNWQIHASQAVFIGVLLLSTWPLSKIIKKNETEFETQHFKQFISELRCEKFKTKKLVIYDHDFDPALFYYIKDDKQKGFNSQLWNENLDLMPENIEVITINTNHENELLSHFNVRLVDALEECKLFHIEKRKE